jgi:hypothetical protein
MAAMSVICQPGMPPVAVTRTALFAGGAAAMGGGCTDRGQYGTGECGDYDGVPG